VQSLGLSDAAPFDIDKKVLGLPQRKTGALVDRTIVDFADEVSRNSPTPGGGSIAALAGALAAALAGMVANLTYGKEGTEARDPELARIATEAQRVKDELIAAVDADSDAFGEFLTAMRMPKVSAEEKAIRAEKMQLGLKVAVRVPRASAEASLHAMRLARAVIDIGLPASLSDGAVGVQMGYAGVRGSIWNVLINLKDIKDPDFVKAERAVCSSLLAEAGRLADEAARAVDERLLAQ
jgi:glutamate formiminotransferase/formiminotetrahydrofolate cyclodeaminase